MLSSAFTNSAFLQIFAVILRSGETCIRTNALLDTNSDAVLVRFDIANYLKLDGVTQNLNIANAVLNQKTLHSKLVSFEIYSDSQPDSFTFTNAWVVSNTKSTIQIPSIYPFRYTHLRDIPFPKLHSGDVTSIIGTDFPKLLLNIKKGSILNHLQ